MSKYELSIVIDAKATAAKKKALSEKVTKIVELLKGKVGSVADLGEKAYGIVLLFPLELGAEAVKSLISKVRVHEEIKKHLLVWREA